MSGIPWNNPFIATRKLPWRDILTVFPAIGLTVVILQGGLGRVCAEEPSYLTTPTEITLLSANDGEVDLRFSPDGKTIFRQSTEDSITVLHLGPDHPPIIKTVYGSVPTTIRGAPHMAISGDGHYGFVTNNSNRTKTRIKGQLQSPLGQPVTNEQISDRDLQQQYLPARLADVVTMIDLSSPDLRIVQRVKFDDAPQMAQLHPDGRHVIVACTRSFHTFLVEDGRITLVASSNSPVAVGSIAVHPEGVQLLVASSTPLSADQESLGGVHLFRYDEGKLTHQQEVQVGAGMPAFDHPFAPRFSPNGERAMVLNGGGLPSKGKLDDALLIDMNLPTPRATEVIRQVGDGLESVAFHPNGKMAVIACLEMDIFTHLGNDYSSLAVVDLTTKPARLLYHTDVESVPEGIEFSPDGSLLFVGSAVGNRIVVFDVDGFRLTRNHRLMRVGHGHSSLTIGARYQP